MQHSTCSHSLFNIDYHRYVPAEFATALQGYMSKPFGCFIQFPVPKGFAPKLNYYVFPKLQTHEKRPQITLMLANARAARRCHSLRSRPASQPLWSCQNYSLIHKATPKRLRSRSERSEDSDALRAEGASALSAVFSKSVQCSSPET